jgi:hypothetical protein
MPIAAIIHKQTWQLTLNPIGVNHLAHSKKRKKGVKVTWEIYQPNAHFSSKRAKSSASM